MDEISNKIDGQTKRKRGRPRKYPPKPVKPKLTKEERSRINRENVLKGIQARREAGKPIGRPKGSLNSTHGVGYHRDNIAAGEPRETMSVLKSSVDVFRKLAYHWDKPLIAAVKTVTDKLVAGNPKLFSRG